MNEEKKKLKDEELDNVAGGAAAHDPGYFREVRFTFNDEDVKKIKEKLNIQLEAGKSYGRGDLAELLGYRGYKANEIKKILKEKAGVIVVDV